MLRRRACFPSIASIPAISPTFPVVIRIGLTLICEQSYSPAEVDIAWQLLPGICRVEVEQRADVGKHEAETEEGDLQRQPWSTEYDRLDIGVKLLCLRCSR